MKGKKSLCGEFCNCYCYCFSPKIVRFQNGSRKVAIELCVVQFWSEIILEITRMISDQIALHSVQLPLLITMAFKEPSREANKIDHRQQNHNSQT